MLCKIEWLDYQSSHVVRGEDMDWRNWMGALDSRGVEHMKAKELSQRLQRGSYIVQLFLSRDPIYIRWRREEQNSQTLPLPPWFRRQPFSSSSSTRYPKGKCLIVGSIARRAPSEGNALVPRCWTSRACFNLSSLEHDRSCQTLRDDSIRRGGRATDSF